MEKWLYEKYLESNKEKSVEDHTIEQIAYANIECRDRAFANNFEAGTAGYYLNALFEDLRVLAAATEDTQGALKNIIDNFENYEIAYKSVKRGIREINNPSRYYEEVEAVKNERLMSLASGGK